MEFTEDLDALGLLCPLPVLKARKRLLGMRPGAVLRVRADDPAAVVDFPNFCRESGNHMVAMTESGTARHFFIRRG